MSSHRADNEPVADAHSVGSAQAEQPAQPVQPTPDYFGEPTRGQIMRKPVWILALFACLAVAGVFAWLGQWQLEHAVQEDTNEGINSEAARSLSELNAPGDPVSEAAAGMVVTTEGQFVADDFRVVEQRMNDGDLGTWVVGNFAVAETDAVSDADQAPRGHLAVAVGWAPTVVEAEEMMSEFENDEAATAPLTISGRYMPAEHPQIPLSGEDPFAILSMTPAQLGNEWETIDAPVYAGFLVLHPDEVVPTQFDEVVTGAGLATIDSVPPLPPEKISWLNLFYAVEWVIFGGFAIFFWFRLTKDAWEKAHELLALESAETVSAADDEPKE